MLGTQTIRRLLHPQPPTPPRVLHTAVSGQQYWADIVEYDYQDGVRWVKLVLYYQYDESKRAWRTMERWTTLDTCQQVRKVA